MSQLFEDASGIIIPIVILLVVIVLFMGLSRALLGLVVIGERQLGVVVKRFDFKGRGLPAGHLVALNNEAGYQADTLSPGWHFGYWSWMYTVHKVPVTVVPQGEIALIMAADGAPIPPDRLLGRAVECDQF